MGFKISRLAMHIGGELHATHKKAHLPSGCFTKDAPVVQALSANQGNFTLNEGVGWCSRLGIMIWVF
jgi:hypothetical protein